MSQRSVLLIVLAIIIGFSNINAVPKKGRVERVGDSKLVDFRLTQPLTTAAACTVGSVTEVYYYINDWVTGNELYKAYIDPSSGCTNPYPFSVTEISMPMHFNTATSIIVSVDIEDADVYTSSCKTPGTMRAISQDYQYDIPGAGGYNIWVPLDSPYSVSGPFFAGFFLGSSIDSSVGAAVYTDTTYLLCRSWNIWDTTTGFVDLADNGYYNFPGRLAMEVIGIPKGSSGNTEPAPLITILNPISATTLLGSTDIWVQDTSGSKIIDYVSFEYTQGGSYTEIGRDYDGTSPLRSGVSQTISGNGFSLNWDFSAKAKGTYTIRATAYDTLGRSSSATTTVILEPIPPKPHFIGLNDGDDICPPQAIQMTCGDPNLQYIQVYRKDAAATYSSGVTILSEHLLGDANGYPNDGNNVTSGEYGDYYSGPASAALLTKLWYDRGFSQIMKTGTTVHSLQVVAESLATAFKTRTNKGTYDEKLYAGLSAYAKNRGNEFDFDFVRMPSYWNIRSWAEEELRGVVLGVNGTKAFWVTVSGFTGWKQTDGTYHINISNPLTGAIEEAPCRDNTTYWEIYIGGAWYGIDIMISMIPKTYTVTRTLIGADLNPIDGWSVNLSLTGLTENNLYFIRGTGRDSTSIRGNTTAVVRYSCTGNYMAGDYNSDNSTDLSDLLILMEYVDGKGNPPNGGGPRADANGDGRINVGDVIYYINFLFGAANPPSY